MNKKTSFTFFGLSALVPIVICVATVGVTSSKDNTYSTKASGGPYELVLNSSNTPDALTDSYLLVRIILDVAYKEMVDFYNLRRIP